MGGLTKIYYQLVTETVYPQYSTSPASHPPLRWAFSPILINPEAIAVAAEKNCHFLSDNFLSSTTHNSCCAAT